ADYIPEAVTNYSRSGLFTVYGPKVPLNSLYISNFMGNQPSRLDPALLTVACEQIKELLFSELGYNARQQLVGNSRNLHLGKIFIVLHTKAEYPITFTGVPGNGLLSYRVDLPNEMFRSRLIETVVQILLIDLANVNNRGPSVSPPVWLAEGLVAHLQSAGLETLPLEANFPLDKKWKRDPLADVFEHLHAQAPLTFEELSWPENLPKERKAVFHDSAQLFVYELLRLKNGGIRMREMIDSLPRYKNWQFAFFRAFSPHFSQSLEVEKWWALNVVDFTGRDPRQAWSREESEKKLNAILKIGAQIHTGNDSLPRRADLPVQQVIKEWELVRQQMALAKIINQLKGLRMRVSPELLDLVDAYRAVLETYLNERSPSERQKRNAPGLIVVQKAACKKLDALDKQYAALTEKDIVRKHPATAKLAPVSSASAK
ncbi:MAG: hypothetical protein JWM68_3057, partial [Verrucomicrobiales bacterium]|nr:hypothetical protein [Verrucomicrobiales bacterium]